MHRSAARAWRGVRSGPCGPRAGSQTRHLLPNPLPCPAPDPRPPARPPAGRSALEIVGESEEGGEAAPATFSMDYTKSPFAEDELPLATARVGLASAYLCLEATLTGSLWLAVGTSAAGMLAAMLLARGAAVGRRSGGAGGS